MLIHFYFAVKPAIYLCNNIPTAPYSQKKWQNFKHKLLQVLLYYGTNLCFSVHFAEAALDNGFLVAFFLSHIEHYFFFAHVIAPGQWGGIFFSLYGELFMPCWSPQINWIHFLSVRKTINFSLVSTVIPFLLRFSRNRMCFTRPFRFTWFRHDCADRWQIPLPLKTGRWGSILYTNKQHKSLSYNKS